jgi:hypothetical protein
VSGSNSRGGSYRTTKANMMRAFDKLPPEVRLALANAVSNHVPQPLLTHLKRGADPSLLLALISIWDRQDLARERKRNATP